MITPRDNSTLSLPALSLDGVSLTFSVSHGLFRMADTLHALSEVDLVLHKGETLGLVGESGCGKSTLAKLLLGILKPDSGRVLIEGRALAELPQRALAQLIQPVFQDPYSSLNPSRTIGAIVEQPLRIHAIAEDRPAKVARMLDLVGLPSRLTNAYPAELSGGQRQRVAIARALILEPSILICDEPTSALDVSVQAQVLNLLAALRRELGLTMLFISHNLAVVEHVADRVAIMYLGRIVEEGTSQKVMKSPRHPYTRALLSSILLPRPGFGIPAPKLGAVAADPFAVAPGCAFQPRCLEAVPECLVNRPALKIEDGRKLRCHLASAGTRC